MSYDASPVWSGFNYQGKVALFHSLREIKKNLLNDETYNFDGYNLLVENHEDFDIESPDGLVSFHQVKAINKCTFGTYANALLAMALQLDNKAFIKVNGYLHTWRKISLTEGENFHNKIKGVVRKVVTNYNDAKDKQLTYIGKALDQEQKNIGKCAAIIRKALVLEQKINDSEGLLAVFTEIIEQGKNSVINRIHQYDYSDNELFCAIDDIDEKVKTTIKEVLKLKGLIHSDKIIKIIFAFLLAKIDEHIIGRHISVNKGRATPIPFKIIISLIVNQTYNDADEEYLSHRFKLKFMHAFETFLGDEDLCDKDTSQSYFNDEKCNLVGVTEILFSASSQDLWEYYKKLNPHINLSSTVVMDNAIEIDKRSIYQSLFPIFSQIDDNKKIHDKQQNKITYKNHDGSRYLPTGIGKDSPKTIVKSIMKNSNNILGLYEIPTMITGDSSAPDIDNFSEEYNCFSDVSIDEFYINEPDEKKEKIHEIISDLRLISLIKAKGEINHA